MKILFPTDFSATANQAREYVCNVAKVLNAEVVICHIIPNILIDPAHERFGNSVVFPSLNQVENVLNNFDVDYRLKEKLNSEMEYFDSLGVKSEVISSFGSVYDQVQLVAAELKCDLVILGTNGASDIEQEFIGSNAFWVSRSSKIPVITLRKSVNLGGENGILLVSNFKEGACEKVVEQAVAFKKTFDCPLDFLFVNTPTQFVESHVIEERVATIREAFNLPDSQLIVFNSTYLETGILNVLSKLNHLGLVIFGNHGYSRIRMEVEYSVADQLISRAKIPIMSVKI